MVTTEVIILLLLFFFVSISLMGRLGTTFDSASPKLGAKIERHIETGSAFADESLKWPDPVSWTPPPGAPGGVKR